MWTLFRIKAKNIASFHELDYTLHQGVTTIVFGNNMDNDSQKSNGSGKSALLEVIAIAITGDVLRKVKMGDIINDSFDEAFVWAEFKNQMTGEELIVERLLSRKEAQSITCGLTVNGEYTQVVKSSPSEYNKYILDKIGLTKDDIHSNFILSEDKYIPFLTCSDKDKKEIINSFSNAVIVDEAIAALESDLLPVEEELKARELEVSKTEGSIAAINEQIEQAKADVVNKENSKESKKEELTRSITSKREEIRNSRELRANTNESLKRLDIIHDKCLSVEDNENLSLVDSYKNIKSIFDTCGLQGFEDWSKKSELLTNELSEKKLKQTGLLFEVENSQQNLDECQERLNTLQKDVDALRESNEAEHKKAQSELDKISEQVKSASKDVETITQNQQELARNIQGLKNKIAGKITCPKCSHVFVLDKNVDVSATELRIAQLTEESVSAGKKRDQQEAHISTLNSSKRKITDHQEELDEKMRKVNQNARSTSNAVNELSKALQSANKAHQNICDSIDRIERDLDGMFNEMFDSAFSIIDSQTKSYESQIKQCENNIAVYEGAIKTFQQSILDLDVIEDSDLIKKLEASLKSYNTQLDGNMSSKILVEEKANELKKQKQHFVEFKTHLANSKIDALSQVTNDFLEKIGSDIRIKFSGFTMLKSGQIRDKISISIIRNGIDCGAFGKFSKGERARINLANILAMQKLTNVNCEDGKGLDLLVLDEVLEATDESGLTSIFDALNSLQITSLVVSHGNIAENYPFKLIVNKKNGVSFLNGNET